MSGVTREKALEVVRHAEDVTKIGRALHDELKTRMPALEKQVNSRIDLHIRTQRDELRDVDAALASQVRTLGESLAKQLTEAQVPLEHRLDELERARYVAENATVWWRVRWFLTGRVS